MFLNGHEYCLPRVGTIYASLALARAWDAHCLFSTPVFNYCAHKFGLGGFPKTGEQGRIQAFQSVFEAYIPNESVFPEYVLFSEDQCPKCVNEEKCKGGYLSELEANLRKIISWRDYDEVYQLKAVVESIVDKRNKSGGVLDPTDVVRDFRHQEDKLRRKVKLTFPKVKRWANITTMLSIPVVVAGVASSSPLITVGGAALAGLSELTKELVDLLSSKYSWIGFMNKETELQKE